MSRQNILCRDKVWTNGEVLCCDKAILCRDRVGQGRENFYRFRAGHDIKLYRTRQG